MSKTASTSNTLVAELSDGRPDSLTQDWSGHTLDMFGALILVIGAVFLVQILLRQLQKKTTGGPNHLRVIQSLSVGTKERVMLVQVGVDQILMGVSAAGIKHLHTLSEPVEAADSTLSGNREESSSSKRKTGFAKTIRAISQEPGSR